MRNRICRIVCDKCGWTSGEFVEPDSGKYMQTVVQKHFEDKHPKSPRFHNCVHMEFLTRIGGVWYR